MSIYMIYRDFHYLVELVWLSTTDLDKINIWGIRQNQYYIKYE
jgi:hypothetical protein